MIPASRGTAGRCLVADVPVLSMDATCGDAAALVREKPFENDERIYHTGREKWLAGRLKTPQLFTLPAASKLSGNMPADWHAVHPDTAQEQMAHLAMQYELTAIPVADDARRLLGVDPAQALIRILRNEHIEVLNRRTGIDQQLAGVRPSLREPTTTLQRNLAPTMIIPDILSLSTYYGVAWWMIPA